MTQIIINSALISILISIFFYLKTNKENIFYSIYIKNTLNNSIYEILIKFFGKSIKRFNDAINLILIFLVAICLITITNTLKNSLNVFDQETKIYNSETLFNFGTPKIEKGENFYIFRDKILFGFKTDILDSGTFLKKNDDINKNQENNLIKKNLSFLGDKKNEILQKQFKIKNLELKNYLKEEKISFYPIDEKTLGKIVDEKKAKIILLESFGNDFQKATNGESLIKIYYGLKNINGGVNVLKVLGFIFNSFISLFIIYFFIKIFKQMGNVTGFEKGEISTKKNLKNLVKFGGNKHLKETLNEIIKLYSCQEKIESLKGILLYGPPGTGKTMFGKYLAKELDIPFHYLSAGSFRNKYYGGTGEKVRNLFKKIRNELKTNNNSNSIIFLDELDSIGIKRDYTHEATGEGLNQLLTEIDGFKSEDGIIIIGATNRLESLDEALLSRFNLKFMVSLPTKEERKEIIKNHLTHLYEKISNKGYINVKNIGDKKILN